jgi:23S rRNA (uracil1939-C5)-methyltransferase
MVKDIRKNKRTSTGMENAQVSGNEPVEIQVEKLVYGGEGLARINGQVVLVPFVLPGEIAEVKTKNVKAGLLRASSAKVIQTAAERVNPGCEYFETCGGCQYQHASYNAQLDAKRAILRETLQRLGSHAYDNEIPILAGEPWSYRNRIQLHSRNGMLGYHQAGSHDLCAIDHCPISSPKLNQAIRVLKNAARQREWPSFLRSIELFTNEQDLQITVTETGKPIAARFFEWLRDLLPESAPGTIDYQVQSFPYRIGRGSFFQVNRFLVDKLVSEVTHDLSGKLALDLYAGVGLFSVPLSRNFERLFLVERGVSAIRDLEANTRQLDAEVEIAKAPTDEFLKRFNTVPDVVVADPPRVGLGKEVTSELLRLRPPQLVLVSCDPATLARDVKALADAYDVQKLTLVDLFPQTYHFETVARLQLR